MTTHLPNGLNKNKIKKNRIVSSAAKNVTQWKSSYTTIRSTDW